MSRTQLLLLILVCSLLGLALARYIPTQKNVVLNETSATTNSTPLARPNTNPTELKKPSCKRFAEEDLQFAQELCSKNDHTHNDPLANFCRSVATHQTLINTAYVAEGCGEVSMEFSTKCENDQLYFTNLSFPFTSPNFQEIPSSINQLKKLTALKLDDTKTIIPEVTNQNLKNLEITTKEFPASITSLKNLKTLTITTKEIPDQISQLNNLEYLSLTGSLVDPSGEWIKKLKHLKRMSLSNYNPTPMIPDTVEELTISDSKIDDNGLIKLNKLRILSVWESKNSTIPKLHAKAPLERLEVSGEAIASIPDWIGNYKTLRSLTIRDTGISKVPETIGNLTELSSLTIMGHLKFKKVEHLPESLGNLKNLNDLNVSNNGLKTLPNSIGDLSKLTSLTLWSQYFPELPPSFMKLKNQVTIQFEYENPPEISAETKKILENFAIFTDSDCGC